MNQVSSDHGPTLLRAGPFSLIYDAGDLRYIRLGDREIVRRIYAAIRDHNWNTISGQLTDVDLEAGADTFRIHYTSTHRRNDIHFVWRAEITGQSNGTIQFSFDGEAKSTFRKNRIGFCILHPICECAGAKCLARYSDGTFRALTFPELVAAEQPVPGLSDLVGISQEIVPDVWADLEFSGDRFETEDQRNWIDASFKTFCTPLSIPYPVEIKAGTRITQEVRLMLADHRLVKSAIDPISSAEAIGVLVSETRRLIPEIGLGMASHGLVLSKEEIAQLRRLQLAHLRCDVKLSSETWQQDLRLARDEAEALDVSLELAVHLSPSGNLKELFAEIRKLRPKIVRVLTFEEGKKTVSAAAYEQAKSLLERLGVPIGVGTDADFYQLNQVRPPWEQAHFVHWSMNPQVHAFDLLSLAETPPAIAAQLWSAASYFPGKELVVSAVTLKPRFNPVSTGAETALPQGELPAQVDPRQRSAFAACWTMAVLKYLAEGGAKSVTLFETTGWRGVMERASGSPLPEKFSSQPGELFPVFHAIAALGAFCGGDVLISKSSDPLRVESLALTREGRICLWLANMTSRKQTVRGPGFELTLNPHELACIGRSA